ncbi:MULTISPECIES: DUF4013 domain-containing protein [unclassified Haloarcula]|uniref:DUF4013 domain-containing protein n=1 Tax=unclassified Haloarcula TaxID=2624677 RepID=UPI001CDA165A|nr:MULTISPECIES: DUF4013 domain-containing protein [unclassified Haloarcula]
MKTIAVGGVLLFLSVLVIPAVFVFGYIVRALRGVMDGDTTPPTFDAWEDLGMDGLKALAIVLVYSLLPSTIVAAVLFISVFTFGSGSDTIFSGLVAGLVFAVVALGTLALSLAAVYAVPAAIVAYVRTDSVSAAFAPNELRPLLFSRTYATGWLVGFAISLIAGIVVGVLNATVVGAILAPFVVFYAYVAGTYAIGTAVRDVPAVGPESETPTAGSAA